MIPLPAPDASSSLIAGICVRPYPRTTPHNQNGDLLQPPSLGASWVCPVCSGSVLVKPPRAPGAVLPAPRPFSFNHRPRPLDRRLVPTPSLMAECPGRTALQTASVAVCSPFWLGLSLLEQQLAPALPRPTRSLDQWYTRCYRWTISLLEQTRTPPPPRSPNFTRTDLSASHGCCPVSAHLHSGHPDPFFLSCPKNPP